MKRVQGTILGFLIGALLLGVPALAAVGPTSYLTEQVHADYNTDGTIDGAETNLGTPCGDISTENPCRYGYAEVGVPNTQDVLQYIRINITDTTNTNLNSPTAYKGALASPNSPWERSLIYFNSSADNDDGDDDYYYNISNSDSAPAIQLSLSYSNDAGGNDFYDEDNIKQQGTVTSTNQFSIVLTISNPSSTRALNGIDLAIQFNTDTGPNNEEDVVHISSVTDSGNGTTTAGPTESNSDDNGPNDDDAEYVTWTGDLGTGEYMDIEMTAELEANNNVNDSEDFIDLDGDDKGAVADWADTSGSEVYLTQKQITGKLTKGPVRQGTDMANSSDGWRIRGFIRNIANETVSNVLTYNVTDWAIYNVDPNGTLGSEAQSGAFDPSELLPADGRVYTTDDRSSNTSWYTSGQTTKPYYATEMDWYVVWNDTDAENYYAFVNSTLDLPMLYRIDMSNDKVVSGVMSPATDGESLFVNDTTEHIGSNNAPAQSVEILSVVPGENTDNEAPTDGTYFDINETSLSVYFINTTGEYEIDNADTSITEPTAAGDNGLVNVTIGDVSAATLSAGGSIGHPLNETEDIRITYEVITNTTMGAGDAFNFTGNTSMTTDSGTPLTEPHPAVVRSVTGKRLSGYKDLIAYDPEKPTLINGSIVISVTDKESGGISGIKFMDYVPLGTNFTNDSVTVQGATGGNYFVNDTGIVTLPNGQEAHAYEYMQNSQGDGWTLNDGESINVSYQFNITTSGLYEMPATLIGVDPRTGTEIRTTALGVIKVKVPKPKQPLEIDQGALRQSERPVVGNPGEWLKKFQVYNPNTRPTSGEFRAKIFKDAEKAWISYTNDQGERIEVDSSFEQTPEGRYLVWKDELKALETRNYEIRLLTPPVTEVNRNVEVLEQLTDKKVKLKMDIFVRNFAKEDYRNLALNLPIPYENVIEVRDSFGDELRFTGGKSSTSVMIDEVKAEDMKTVSIIYKQPYPTIIVTPQRDSYDLGAPVNLSILVINGGQEIEYPKIETEIYAPGMQVIQSQIRELDKLDPLEKTELMEKYVLSTNLPSGEYIANVRFREDFATLASGTGKFYVQSSFGPGGNTIPTIILILAIIGVGYLSYSRLKEIRRTE